MISKEQAINLHHGQTLHYTGFHDCSIHVGPRGGTKENVTRVRISGKVKTWKTRPARFEVPVKYGMYESSSMDEANAGQFHLPKDCPAGISF